MRSEVWIPLLTLAGLAVAAAVWRGFKASLNTWIQERVRAGIQAGFDKQLESHKHDLQLVADTARYEHERRVHALNQFFDTRQEVYARLYRLLLVADGNIRSLFGGIRYHPTFEEYDASDLEALLVNREFPSGKRREIAEAFAVDRVRALELYVAYSLIKERDVATRSFQRAQNYFLSNSLFLSRDVDAAAEQILDLLHDLQFSAMFPDMRDHDRERTIKESLRIARAEIKQLMAGELASGSGPTANGAVVPSKSNDRLPAS